MEDLDFLAELNADVEVMRHVSGRAFRRSETEAGWARRLGPRSDVDQGLGYWVGTVASQPIGWWGVGHTATRPSAGELGFRLRATHWRQGFGSEGARMVLRHAFEDCALDRVWAGTVTANTASRRTLSAVRMTQVDEPVPGVLTYEVTRPEWVRGGGEDDLAAASPGTGHPVGEAFPDEAVRYDDPDARPRPA